VSYLTDGNTIGLRCIMVKRNKKTMWREGYDYPADDEDEGRDYYEEADEQHDKHQDEKLDR